MNYLYLFAGVIIGSVISNLIFFAHGVGTLRMYFEDEERPYIYIDFSKGLNSIFSKHYVVLRIKRDDYKAQK